MRSPEAKPHSGLRTQRHSGCAPAAARVDESTGFDTPGEHSTSISTPAVGPPVTDTWSRNNPRLVPRGARERDIYPGVVAELSRGYRCGHAPRKEILCQSAQIHPAPFECFGASATEARSP